MWTEPRIDNLLLTIVPHQSRMFRSSAVPWALQLTCGQSIMISLSQLPPAQSLSAVAVTLYARALIVKRAGIVRLCPTLHWRMKPKEWPWYGLWSIFGLNVLQHPEASCFIIVWRACALWVFVLLCTEAYRMTLVWPLEHLWLERLAASRSVLFHHSMACSRIERLCLTLHRSLKNDLGMAFGASLIWTSCSVQKRLVSL